MPNGISEDGFTRKRLDEILEDKNAAVRGALGDDLNLSPESPDGQINGVYSESDSNLWSLAEACYNAFSPSKASGAALSDLVELNGIERQDATSTSVELLCSGVPGVIIPIDSLCSTEGGVIVVKTLSSVTIGAGGTVSVPAESITTGVEVVLAGEITNIDTPISGWAIVTNPLDGITGEEEETDAELRVRRNRSVSRSAISILDSIVAEVLAVSGVTYTAGFENDQDVTDPNGLPPHSTLIVVEGGGDDDIAQAIFIKKVDGIQTTGNSSGNATDSQGVVKPINFSRPNKIEIHVRVDINTFEDFPPTGIQDIKQAIVDYANGDLIEGRGFGVNDDVIRTELFTPVNTVNGLSVSILTILAGSPAGPGDFANIAIGFDERSEFTIANIEVNVL